MEFAKRMDRFGEGIFSKLAELKKEKISKGEEVIDLSIGAPNIPPAPHIREALCRGAAKPENYVYAISDRKELLEAAARWYERRYNVKLDPGTEICSLLGSQEGLSHIAFTIADEGDVVLVPDPCYPVFGDGPQIAGASLYYMPQKKEHDYVIQLEEIPEDVARKAKLMVVSYPNNPTAAMAPDSFYEELIVFAKNIISLFFMITHIVSLCSTEEPGAVFCGFPEQRRWEWNLTPSLNLWTGRCESRILPGQPGGSF